MSDKHREIATRLGAGFVAISEEYLPVVLEAVKTQGKPISFGCTVTFKADKDGLVSGSVRTRAPKIPVADMDAMNFTCQVERGGQQMEFLFAGTPNEMREAIAAQAEEQTPLDPSEMPSDNAGDRSQTG